MSRVIGVMSTFNPDSSVASRAIQHLEQLERLIVIDDGSNDSQVLDKLLDDRISVVRLETNSGIAKALNTGTKLAIKEGAKWVLHLDQDSTLTPNYVSICLKTFNLASESTRLGIVLADLVNEAPAIPPRYSPEGFGLVDEGIQSGMMISASCLDDIGLLDERLFIDCVDTEYCLRARDSDWNIAIAPGTQILHSLGTQKVFAPFGITKLKNGTPVLFEYHSPLRQYYIVRNNIDLCIRNIFIRPRWVISVLRREFIPQLKNCIGTSNTRPHIYALFWGVIHGIVRRRGKIPAWLAKDKIQ